MINIACKSLSINIGSEKEISFERYIEKSDFDIKNALKWDLCKGTGSNFIWVADYTNSK